MFPAAQRILLSALTAATTVLLSATPASAAAVAAAPPAAAAAAAVHLRQAAIPVNDWITIDSNGHAKTITPSVVTSNGALTTISPPPYSLTGSVFTVTATSGSALTTSTGAPPPPQASNTLGYGGVFPVCNNRVGNDSPFCFPGRGNTLHVESTYYITWDTTFFADPATPVVIIGFDVDNGVTDSAPAFSVTNLVGGDGWVPWTPRVRDLEDRDSNNMTIILVYSDPETGEEMNKTGPVFTVRATVDTDPSSSRPNLLAIVLPVILISLAIAAVMLWLYIRRRRRHAAAAAAALERQSVPYTPTKGQAQAQARDMTHAHKGSADIQPGPTSPSLDESPGRNVFQDEVRRQDRERK
ncbi:hypothetical protein CH63R_01655 [Colletotrichum higginsianum IMI 349063]|uniref:Uncharacterized protein n=2 Tax=Colletotrichum higginsianum TaxID=80884 RepID=A0A1B7YWR2_COLHI|nr:hypothetical protein CH63R_01655 [Colletotrichum higginsianum IMI 349063]OBR16475.1 hypothetical protein CH63R_01655 [Colletotrichum higginsianum IMI 349063]TID04395.1 hypothetical protein CH35J_001838 [Colletotrichum higginsianum]GJC91293.1 hypothetical protein ColKHC_00119 [Colletotrichum higginsianum]